MEVSLKTKNQKPTDEEVTAHHLMSWKKMGIYLIYVRSFSGVESITFPLFSITPQKSPQNFLLADLIEKVPTDRAEVTATVSILFN